MRLAFTPKPFMFVAKYTLLKIQLPRKSCPVTKKITKTIE